MVIREAWDGKPLAVATKTSPAKATNPHVSLITHVTKAELGRALTETDMLNGFGNRFLWIAVERSKLLPTGGIMPQRDIERLGRETCKALEQARRHNEIRRDADAEHLWCESLYFELERNAERPGLLGAMTCRASPQVLRLAMIYALTDQVDAIKVEHLEAAAALWRYCFDSARFIFGEAIGDPIADRIHAELRTTNGLSRTDIANVFGRNLNTDRIDTALRSLLAQGLVDVEKIPTSGRPREQWHARSSGD